MQSLRCMFCKYKEVCRGELEPKLKELKEIKVNIVDAIDELYSLRRELTRLQRKRDELYDEIDNEE